ncbi:deoxyribodipyrimidine photolyase [Chromatium weissei]|nr:deoxyribodipyrimidine photolyase [Chromatium weissei]
MSNTTILWFRRDLRLDDNSALLAALADGASVVPVYIHAPHEEAPWAIGAASRWWLHGSLLALDEALRQRGSRLWITQGDSLTELRRIAAFTGATQVRWNRLYDPVMCERDTRIKQALRNDGLQCASTNAALLFEPWEIRNGSGQPYRVFSAFWRMCVKQLHQLQPQPAPAALPPIHDLPASLTVADLELLPRIAWDQGWREMWTPGEHHALQRARTFLETQLVDYGVQRDFPAISGTSQLSAPLHFGEISPRRLLAMLRERDVDSLTDPWLRELGWREFGYHLLHHFPHTTDAPLDTRFAAFPWRTENAAKMLTAWQRGNTGIPLVDAGMRELWHTGWMHNRVRMVVASLLTKNLLLPWQLGARWFWDTLIDADLACNTAGWQWTAGCGADAAPYFRVFNPVLQAQRFDSNGDYIRRWCPELARLPNAYLHQPWTAPASLLAAAGIRLGNDYPAPIIDLAASRQQALATWEQIKVKPI